MGLLKNQRHELFAQLLAKGASNIEAYEKAGYKPDSGAASRLSGKVSIQARVDELLGKAAEKTVVTIESITKQLIEDREAARKFEQAGAMVSASMGVAKLHGLIKDRHEHTGANGGAIQTEDVSDTDAARRIAFLLSKGDQAADTQH